MKLDYELQKYIVNEYATIRKNKILFTKDGKKVDIVKDAIEFIQIKHVQMAVLDKDDIRIFIILGSNEFVDWLYNFKFSLSVTPYKETGTNKKIKVHNGFLKSYLLIRDVIKTRIDNVDKIIFMGHSFGAAVATLAALDTQYNHIKQIALLTTGSPRVGNKYFVKSFNKRVPDTYRYVNGNDIVTHVPFELLGYKHVSKPIHIGTHSSGLFLSIVDHMYSKGAYINLV